MNRRKKHLVQSQRQVWLHKFTSSLQMRANSFSFLFPIVCVPIPWVKCCHSSPASGTVTETVTNSFLYNNLTDQQTEKLDWKGTYFHRKHSPVMCPRVDTLIFSVFHLGKPFRWLTLAVCNISRHVCSKLRNRSNLTLCLQRHNKQQQSLNYLLVIFFRKVNCNNRFFKF